MENLYGALHEKVETKFKGALTDFLKTASIYMKYLDDGINVIPEIIAQDFGAIRSGRDVTLKTMSNHLKADIHPAYTPKQFTNDCKVAYLYAQYIQGANVSRILKKKSIAWKEKTFAVKFKSIYGELYQDFDLEKAVDCMGGAMLVRRRFRLFLIVDALKQ